MEQKAEQSHNSHNWNVTPKEAVEIQKKLREKVRIEPFAIDQIRYIAGADVSMNLYSSTVYAGFVILSYPDHKLVDHSVVVATTKFPYIPGLLSFREIPALIEAWQQLMERQTKTAAAGMHIYKPDLIVVDGAGIAHPRRMGIATHLGVVLDMPTIGCAKSLLTGTYEEPGIEPGDYSYLYDKADTEEVIGAVMRTKRNVKPIFVSPGHKINLDQSIKMIFSCIKRHRLPEPTRIAHIVMNEYRKGNMKN